MNDRLCHTDIHMQRNDWGVSNYPVVLGHEGKERDFIYEFFVSSFLCKVSSIDDDDTDTISYSYICNGNRCRYHHKDW